MRALTLALPLLVATAGVAAASLTDLDDDGTNNLTEVATRGPTAAADHDNDGVPDASDDDDDDDGIDDDHDAAPHDHDNDGEDDADEADDDDESEGDDADEDEAEDDADDE